MGGFGIQLARVHIVGQGERVLKAQPGGGKGDFRVAGLAPWEIDSPNLPYLPPPLPAPHLIWALHDRQGRRGRI